MIGWAWRRAKRVWHKIHLTPVEMPAVLSVRVREIEPSDLNGIIDLLTAGFWRYPRRHWAGIMQRLSMHQTPEGFPKYGYMLENDGTPVGVLLMIFSARTIDGVTRVWGNESSYYVEPHFRFYASLLVKRAHRHKDVTYLDLTPSSHRWTTLDSQGYKRLAKGVYASIPILCWPISGVKTRVVTDTCHDVRLEPFELDLLVAHAGYGCISVVCENKGSVHPFVFVVRRRYGLPYAYLIYSRDQADFIRFGGTLGRFLAKKRGIAVAVLDTDGPIAVPGRLLQLKPKYWHGSERPRLGDLAYTEIPMFGVI
jgi:hypothetical protein